MYRWAVENAKFVKYVSFEEMYASGGEERDNRSYKNQIRLHGWQQVENMCDAGLAFGEQIAVVVSGKERIIIESRKITKKKHKTQELNSPWLQSK